MISAFVSYAAISALVASSPGPSNFIAARNGASYGLVPAAVAITGHMMAVCLLALLCAVGIGAMLTASEHIFSVIKYAGAGYLLFIGYKMLVSKPSSGLTLESNDIKNFSLRKLWLEHFLVAVGNPKALLFFTALFPQFINTEQGLTAQFSGFLLISMCSSFIFPFSYALLAFRIAKISAFGRMKRWFSKGSGILFLGFGFALALAK